MNSLYAELQWLPRAPEEFSERLKALGTSTNSLGQELQALALHALNLNQLAKLGKAIERARANGRPLDPLIPFKLAVLSNSTIDMIVPALVASATRHGIALEVILPAYDQVAQEVLNPDSKVNGSKPDAVLLALDYRALPLKTSLGDPEASSATVYGVIGYLRTLRDAIKANSNAVCIFQNFAPPAETLFGSLDCALPGTMRNLLEQVNNELGHSVRVSGDVLLDVAGVAATVGLADWHDPQLWNLGKFSFSAECIPLYADHVVRTIAAMRGKSRRALILDLDNTVWGGVIGDDGLEGIKLIVPGNAQSKLPKRVSAGGAKFWKIQTASLLYPFFLYANFSGYVDIVIALVRLMRVRLPENFDRPFSASSFIDFWNRWHITLSTWLKNYVYNPLLVALMRRISSLALQPVLGLFSFSITFFLVGVWHGRTSEFIFFGLLQGGGVAINKLWQLVLTRTVGRKGYKTLADHPIYVAFGRGLTFSWFAFTLIWFWADWKRIDMLFAAIGPMQWVGVWLVILLCTTLVLGAWEALRAALLSIRTSDGPVLTNRYTRVIFATVLGLAAFIVTALLNQSAPAIVYKEF